MFIFNYSSLYFLIIVLNIRSADVQGTYRYLLNTITFILETDLCIYESNLLLQVCIIVLYHSLELNHFQLIILDIMQYTV